MTGLMTTCADETATAQLGETLALALRPGDLVFLRGDLGAGKTTLARSLIRSAAQDQHLEVPSPTFTLMQVYEGLPFGRLAHIDLYRIEHPEEMEELGLGEVLEDGAALVEWPEKGIGSLPTASLEINFKVQPDDSRVLTFAGSADTLKRLDRSLSIRDFLDTSGFKDSIRTHLTGDASTRAYEMILLEDRPDVILMNAPEQPDGPPILNGKPYSAIAKLAENTTAFVGVAKALQENGFRSPEILANDLEDGLLLIENLGSNTIIDKDRRPIEDRYMVAVELLADFHTKKWNPTVNLTGDVRHVIPELDRDAILIEVSLLTQWYAPNKLGEPLKKPSQDQFNSIWDNLIKKLETSEKSLVLRDYHSPNIIWMDEATGTNRIGLIDFQDALIGPTAYDVASLAQDARADISDELETKLVNHYCQSRLANSKNFDEESFRSAYAIMAAERATKVLGIFIRLSERDQKHGYLDHLPRIEDYLKRSLRHPVLAEYGKWMADEFQL